MTLIDRLQALEAPDREVDAEIFKAIGFTQQYPHEYTQTAQRFADHKRWIGPDGENYGIVSDRNDFPLAYTASVDSALSLVPEGWFWDWDGQINAARVFKAGILTAPKAGIAQHDLPAIAICIAARKALGDTK